MGYDRKAAEFRNTIDGPRRRVKQRLGQLRHLADDSTAALHAAMQHEQAWRRIARRLEAVDPKERAKVVDQLIREDVTTLRVLHTELPSYLQASWPGLVPTAQKKVTDALLPLASGAERVALEARQELDETTRPRRPRSPSPGSRSSDPPRRVTGCPTRSR
jgi:hypothetical protein